MLPLKTFQYSHLVVREKMSWKITKRFFATEGSPTPTMKELRKQMLLMMSSVKSWFDSTDKQKILANLPTDQSQLPVMSMASSLMNGVIPLSVNSGERLKYQTPYHDQVRFGRILEDLDTFAVACCYKHNETSSPPEGVYQVPRAIWTVLVDRIDLSAAFRNVVSNKDIFFSGHVSWVGRSSMEAIIDVTQKDSSGLPQKLIEAVFVMVARNPLDNGPALVNRLEAGNETEKTILLNSEAHQKRRKLMSDESLLKTAPNETERALIHDIFLETLDPSASTFKVRVKPQGSKWMDESMLKTVRICFPEQKNLYNKIFGGFLMRQAFELAWANACTYSKNRCIALAVDDIVFRAPVSIGSFLYLSSQVGYTEKHKMQVELLEKYLGYFSIVLGGVIREIPKVRVHAEVRDPETDVSCTTNEFHFTLETADGTPVPTVLPKTYAESMIYLDSRRRFDEAMSYRMQAPV